MATFSIQQNAARPDEALVTVDNRFAVAIMRNHHGLMIHVFPITDGQIWDDPLERFSVDETEIRALEEEMGG